MVSEEEIWRYHPRYNDRPEAILTKDQREYLFGESDIESKSARSRSMRQNIRRRVTDGILDFSILLEHLEDRDRDEIFNDEAHALQDEDEDMGSVPMGQVSNSAIDTIAFVFQHVDNEHGFSKKVEKAIERAAHSAGYDADANVDIDIDLGDRLYAILERLETKGPESVSHAELRTLLDAGELTHIEHAEIVLEKAENTDHDRARRVEMPDDDE